MSLLLLATMLTAVRAKIDMTYSKLTYDQTYNEKSLCTAYKCEHSAPDEKDKIYFMMYFDGPVGFDSPNAALGGPFVVLKSDNYVEYYNLRYGASSTKDYASNSLQTKLGLVYFSQAFFLVLMLI